MGAIEVALGERSYTIEIKRGLLREIGPRLASLGFGTRCALVTNPRVGGLYAERVRSSLEGAGFEVLTIELPDGEEYKNLAEISKLYDRLIESRMERGFPLLALGGGVIGDITGFVAATYLRGVPYIQIPTTLLSQVDSSVGGKTGVNHPEGKNLIGAFYQPSAVFIDPDVLKSLDPREVKAGLAEVVKYGVIRDEAFFRFLEEKAASLAASCDAGPGGNGGDDIVKAIERSCEIKAEVVAADETEKGLRSILNFGHTFGHAIEAATGYMTFKHGEAVSMGMVMAAGLSESLGLCAGGTGRRIEKVLESMGIPVEPPGLAPDVLIPAMRLDKKVRAGRMRFVLVSGVGEVELREVSEEDIRGFLSGRAA